MASGSSAGRANSKGGFDFASDDILCSSYDDYDNHHESSNGTHSDPAIGANSGKDFQKSRLSRSPVFPPTNVYAQPEDSLDQELITTVERTMKKYTDNLMRFLEGVSSRLSQLELYCYNLDKSIGEMRSELASDNREADAKLKSLDKHLQEVHRSVQILRDKQELAETQKELAKLQLAHKDSSGSQQEEKSVTPTSESRKSDDAPESNNQLALALPHQITPQPPPQTTSQAVSQQPPYYLPAPQMPNAPAPSQIPQGHYPPTEPQYRQTPPNPPQGQVNLPLQPPTQPPQQQYPQGQVNLPPQPQPQPQQQQFPQYQQQWSQQVPPSSVYPAYIQNQPTNPPPQEPQPPYGYSGSARPIQTQVPAQAAPGSHPPVPSSGSYMMYDREGGRTHHPPPAHFSQAGGYPHPHPHPQPASSSGLMVRAPGPPPQFVRNHPYNELIEKLVSMGYRGDHVTSVIQRLEESGQPVDFNTVLDRLNGHGSGGPQRAW